MWDRLWIDANLATLAGETGFGEIVDGAVAVADGRIAWIGRRADLPGPPETLARAVESIAGRWITPGLVDCHTHLVFAGERVGEFERQIGGATRAELAAEGGGIMATVRATRAASEAELGSLAQPRLEALMAEGVTTVEIKSGYGLDLETELRMLRVARALGRHNPVTVMTSFLGAHTLPPDYAGRSADYIAFLAESVLPAAMADGLVDICDGGVELGLSIPPAHMDRLFLKAKALGLPIRAHADQYGDAGGAAFLAARGALSADHLEYAGEAGLRAMAAAGTVAVLLPGANFFLHETRMPPVALMRAHGVAMALATNCNPGSSPLLSPCLAMALACHRFRLTPAEALRGMTVNGAKALDLESRVGRLVPGLDADLAFWDVAHPAELAYWLGGNACVGVVRYGERVR